MTKTIEEAAKRFADMKTTKQAGSSVERDRKALLMTQFFRYTLEELPLSERMTAEEKDRVRKMYEGELEFAQFYQRKANSCINQQCRMDYEASRDIAKSRADMLESIFGADFFKEGK